MDRTPQPEIDHATIAPIVRRLYGRSVEIVAWQATPIGEQSLGLSAGVFRVTGSAGDGSAWSVILKMLRPVSREFLARFAETDRDRLQEAYLWDREARLYESGLLDRLPVGFSAAACLGSRRTDGACWLWFEDLGAPGPDWDAARYALAARHLGRFNGTFEGARIPDASWLCRDWIRTWVLIGFGSRAPLVLANDEIWAHPLVRAAFAPDARARLRRGWASIGTLLDRLDALPQVLSHLDAFRANLFDRAGASAEGETVAIDWSYVGPASIGAEVSQLVVSSVALVDRRQDVRELEAVALDAYVAGLRDSGWHGDERDVRAGHALAAARWLFMLGPLTAVLDPDQQARRAAWAKQSYEDLILEFSRRTAYLLDLVENAERI